MDFRLLSKMYEYIMHFLIINSWEEITLAKLIITVSSSGHLRNLVVKPSIQLSVLDHDLRLLLFLFQSH